MTPPPLSTHTLQPCIPTPSYISLSNPSWPCSPFRFHSSTRHNRHHSFSNQGNHESYPYKAKEKETMPDHPPNPTPTPYTTPKITIEYCTQCKWLLRAAYYAQELLSTFSTDLGGVELIPRTGGLFAITVYASASVNQSQSEQSEQQAPPVTIWERKRDGGFPEVKELKNRVRNLIDPGRSLGHTDRALKKGKDEASGATSTAPAKEGGDAGTGTEKECEDCK
ncbi:SelT/SelW/SelH family protein [Aspergillus stella-maris]|uniref:SelT/SelW/SelH family protein n=1 Tax=Aspergillus stella-maris TaxID=1810926 RepID=UPI003CCCCAF2